MAQGSPSSPKKSKPRPSQNLQLKAMLDSAYNIQKQGNFAQAEVLYQQVLKAEPGNPFSLYGLGSMALQRGELAKAVQLLKQSVANGYHAAATYTQLGIALQTLGRLDEAAEVYRLGIKADPKHPGYPANLSVVLSQKGDLDGALKTVLRAIKLDPAFVPAYINAGGFLQTMDRIPEAIQMVEKALALDPANAEAKVTLGQLRDRLPKA
jgi:superkiller protein 3